MFSQTKKITESKSFQRFIIGVIIFAGVLVGAETYKSFAAEHHSLLHILDKIVLWIFVIEIVLKMISEGNKPWNYFKDGWNVFDFLIVAVCFIPTNGIDTSFIAVLRLARILRVFKLVTALPKLQIIIGALLKSIPSMGYVFLLLALHFYIFGCMATFFYGENDPFHFGNLQTSMLSLFRAVTMEGWSELMYINMYGSDLYYSPEIMQHLAENGITPVPSASPLGAAIYFVSFILTGGMIVINLFIGVIMSGMDEMKAEAELEVNAKKTKNTPLHEEILVLQKQLQEMSNNLLTLSKKVEIESHKNTN